MTQWLEMRLAHIRQTAEEKDVLLYPWRPKAGLGTEPKVHSCERRMETPDRYVLLFPWWPDGAQDSHWNAIGESSECEVQDMVGPMCGLPASCACLKASA